MSRCRVLPVLGASALLAALSLAFVPLPQDGAAGSAAAASGTYAIDSGHSSVLFRVKHAGVSYFHGRFNEVHGSIVLDAAEPAKSSVELVIPVASVDTANAKRDQHLKTPDFFSAQEFPEIRFASSSVKELREGLLEVTGELAMHGETRPLTVQVELTGSLPGSGRRPAMVGFETVFSIKRSEFGMDQMLEALGDEVRITLAVEAGMGG